jgi:hypothetical protein
MYTGKTVFAQLMDFIPAFEFQRCVDRYGGHNKVQTFTCWNQFLCMAFAQLTYRESLRDIEVCLRSMGGRLYHMGIRGNVARSTLADANERRDWRIYADLAYALIERARALYIDEPLGLALRDTVYALDSTTIDLCLSLFPWATFRKRKGAIKLHTQLDLRGSIPTFIWITHGKCHDVHLLDELPIEAGAIYVMDRGYLDFLRLNAFNQAKAFFVIRAKRGLLYRRLLSSPVDKDTGLRSDQLIELTGVNTAESYPEKLRRVRFYDADQKRSLVFLTNDFIHGALTVAKLYKNRWKIELFFKWIKQHLRIKVFYGNSENAVKTQVWIAIAVYVLVAIAKKALAIDMSLHTFLQVLSLSTFEKVPINELVTNTGQLSFQCDPRNPLLPFDL